MLSGKTEEGEELRKRIASEKLREFLCDPKNKENWSNKISKTLTGRTLSLEHRENIKKGHAKRKMSGKKRAERKLKDSDWHKKHYEKNRDKITAGRLKSPLWRKSISSDKSKQLKREKMLGREITWNDKISEARRNGKHPLNKIVCIDGVNFNSIKSAARAYNLCYHRLLAFVKERGNILSLDEILSCNPAASR